MSIWSVITPVCFSLELLICESIFLLRQKRKDHFSLRLTLYLIVYLAAMVGLNWINDQLSRSVFTDILFFLFFFVGAMAMVPICFRLTVSQSFFVAAAGYSVEHISDSLVKIVMLLLVNTDLPQADSAIVSALLSVLMLILPYAAIAALFFFLMVKKAMVDDRLRYSDRRVLSVSALNLCICLVLSVVSDHAGLSRDAMIICRTYAILGCLICLLTQAGLFRDGKIARTNQILQQMIQLERDQHRMSREVIDFINIRCHDLRHQIALLNSMSEEKRRQSVEELSRAIMIFDSITRTGNDALDTVLMEKMMLCDKYRIRFSFVGDAAPLDALDEVDIYSLFGNMLDNAIESLQKEPDEEKRLITLRVYTRKKMLYIEMDNYFSTPLVYRNGEIQTSKQEEPGLHGYGLKSISYIVGTYKGDMLITTENRHFIMQIMIPEAETPA